MGQEYQLSYTGKQIDEKLGKVDNAILFTAQYLSKPQQEQAKKNLGIDEQETDPNRDAEFFDITIDGMVFLKPNYRGAVKEEDKAYTYAVSNKGVGKAGPDNSKLPKDIVIPEVVNEIAVTEIADGMFLYNQVVESITIPKNVTKIPDSFVYRSFNLKEIKSTENIKELGYRALSKTHISTASFPNLEKMDEKGWQFWYSPYLIYVELGNKITSIPKYAFFGCEKLSCVYGCENVTSFANEAFTETRRLRNMFVSKNVTNVGKNCFNNSRLPFKWETLTNCKFEDGATYHKLNSTDFWTNCNPVDCHTDMRSVFNQYNPDWATKTIGNTDVPYHLGCNIISGAMIYSALFGVDFASPEEFVELAGNIKPALLDLDTRRMDNMYIYLSSVGLSVVYKSYKENLQDIYDALASGSLIYASIEDGDIANTTGHAVVFHGINEAGEILVQDPTSFCAQIGIYDSVPYSMPIQNMVSDKNTHCLVVTKV